MEHKDLSILNAKRSIGINMNDSDIADVWLKVRDDNDLSNWLLISVVNNLAVLKGFGVTFEEMVDNIHDDQIYYGVIRVIVSGKVKFFGLYIAGSSVSGIQKGKAAMAKSGVFKYFDGLHAEFSYDEEISEISKINISEKIRLVTKQTDIKII
jgi:hypothetical protein